jgi:hypothetical protein
MADTVHGEPGSSVTVTDKLQSLGLAAGCAARDR